MKKTKAIGMGVLLGLLASCGDGTSSVSVYTDTTTFNGTDYYDTVETRAGFDETYEGNIDEHLENGVIDDDVWYALEGVWQNDSSAKPHAGVKNRNLFYVQDGDETYLGFRGRGLYCQDEDLSTNSSGQVLPEGGCIITKEKLIPGRYEIEMAAFPRYGGVSACWTYLCETGNEATSQNEIDIEIGGHTDGETFKYLWSTSWTNSSNKQTVDVDVSDILYLNDGQFHKYTFDWYTEYLDTGYGRVDWFIDGILVASVRGSLLVTDIQMPLWIGLWFPNWTNNAAFDTDYMLMKSFKFTAFDTTQYYEESRTGISYTTTVPSEAGIQTITYDEVKNVNKIANGEFTQWTANPLDGTYGGWEVPESNAGTVTTVNEELALTYGTGRAYTRQIWEEVYEGFSFDYSFKGRLADSSSSGKLEIHYTNSLGVDIATATTIDIDSTEDKTYSGSITAPEKCRNIQFRFYGEAGTTYVDDVNVVYTGYEG